MNIYADRGNLLLLERRCEWRGHRLRAARRGLGDAVDPDAHDLFYLGGGQDRDQQLCAQDWRPSSATRCTPRPSAGASSSRCAAGYQLLGHSYELGGERLPGVGLVDLETVRDPGRG
jgi:CobQ-like glutamine amidotransferase family enzyme